MSKYANRPSPVFSGRSVLVVDDQPVVRSLLAKMLAGMGFEEIEEATDGSDALCVLDKRGFHVILCDINMQPMGGMDFVRRLRAGAGIRYDQKRASTPVLFLTGHADPEYVQEAKTLGVKGYLLKPIDQAKLRERLLKLFGA